MILFVFIGLLVILFLIWGITRYNNAQKYKIQSPSGVQKSSYVRLGGIQQFVQIRGQDRSNPVIIVLHGGPGNNMGYYSYAWQADLESDYTIVHWDQRGCGNTYFQNKAATKPTFDLLLSDLDALVNSICGEYGQEKVIIMGHSWGTLLGGIYAGQHPEKVAAYVGVGQFNDVWQSEEFAAEEAALLAKAAGKLDTAKKIQEQFQLVRSSERLDMRDVLSLRQLTGKFLPEGENTSFSDRVFSPYLTFNDVKWFFAPIVNFEKYIELQNDLYRSLYSQKGLSSYNYTAFKVPVIIIAGDCDWITPYQKSREYFDQLIAPKKEFITIENAGHIPFIPGQFGKLLQGALREVL
ncbi:alpha/beta hydrolase [Enterococcus sp. 669A]|uniref:prolyl aminopeptidase n=1 Tax=Candidatus Enterococcus moelleringii TaxID=2815325 RepID=A0ABS3LBY6_9ENTE|nr:alpha/beta hydrolase [Enterococcus sp. 669A]MBO1307150.1 alpha/beta hydrolase [Enterococcus sp. 669A]